MGKAATVAPRPPPSRRCQFIDSICGCEGGSGLDAAAGTVHPGDRAGGVPAADPCVDADGGGGMGRDLSVGADCRQWARAAAPPAHRSAGDPAAAVACDGQGGLRPLCRRRRPAGAAVAPGCRLCFRSAGGGARAAGGAARARPPRLPRARQPRARVRCAPRWRGRAPPQRDGQSSSFFRTKRALASRRQSSAFPRIVFASSGTCRVGPNCRRSTIGPRHRSFFIITAASRPIAFPLAVVEAVRRLGGRACLRIAGYEAPGAAGYVQRLLDLGAAATRRDRRLHRAGSRPG